MFIKSPVDCEFTFTPSFSIYLACDSEAGIDKIYNKIMKKNRRKTYFFK